MSNLSPSIPEWKDLYNAAIEFKQIECWNWMEDSDLFGVQNPEDGEIGYCCVLGALGEVFGLAVYLGAEGLNEYLKVQSGEIAPKDFDAVHQRCLLASFEDRRLLQRPDLEVIKKLGLKFRGSKSWSLFRSYQPGYYPWYLNKKEAIFLTIALQQAKEVFIPCIAIGELFFGALKSERSAENMLRVDELAASSIVLSCDTETAKYYGEIKNVLRIKGNPLPENDI